ncbi:UNVERIFIED_CONTAM: hypothetical protein Scaly_2034400 [Sesamum calycinum]|uniref:Uncharacterized protein n=1 Tax=Sesamum calycinum TaxID=2727403 RepID=A0AAW2N334_9LAMI
MAGMLPGVEAARRRRFHNSNPIDGAGASTTRPSSFCLYANNYSHQLNISPCSSMERKAGEEEKLDATAREAKKRLDHRLHTCLRSEIKRY